MRIILIRHAQSFGNKNDIIQGQSNSNLSQEGKWQARKIALRLKRRKIDIIYSSDLERAKETAKIIKKFHKKTKSHTLKILRERNFGSLEGKSAKEFDIVKLRYRRPKGGEAQSEVKKRAEDFLKYLIKKYSKEAILVVTHGGIMRMVYSLLKKKSINQSYQDLPSGSVKNTSLFEIKLLANKKFKIVKQKCTRHLV